VETKSTKNDQPAATPPKPAAKSAAKSTATPKVKKEATKQPSKSSKSSKEPAKTKAAATQPKTESKQGKPQTQDKKSKSAQPAKPKDQLASKKKAAQPAGKSAAAAKAKAAVKKPTTSKPASKIVKRAKGAKGAKGKLLKPKKPQPLKFIIDATRPIDDTIMDSASLEKFLHDRIKVKGKTGVLGNAVSITRDKQKIYITAQPPFSKRYLKYLAKKFLKKQQLRDWLRVVSVQKNTYELRYFNIHENEGEEEEE